MTRRIRLTLEYDGSAYCGWQTQANGPSVQAQLELALRRLTGVPHAVTGASRTDAGVHALGQTAHFDTQSRIPAEKFCFDADNNIYYTPAFRKTNSCYTAGMGIGSMIYALKLRFL